MGVDIRKEIQRQVSFYRETKDPTEASSAGQLVMSIVENEGLIYAEVAKDREKIVERIKEGMIPVVMPGRSVQERTWGGTPPTLNPSG